MVVAVISLVAQRVENLPAMQETWVQSLGRRRLTSLMSPALASRFFTTSATWEALERG